MAAAFLPQPERRRIIHHEVVKPLTTISKGKEKSWREQLYLSRWR